MKAVDRAISDGIFRHQLEGFEKYPRGRDERFLEVFSEQVVSVDHARAVALEFREKMPTLQEIIDTALNLRPRFECTPSDRERWEAEYGKPQPFDIPAGALESKGREIDRLWQDVLFFLRSTGWDGRGARGDIQQVHWGRCWQIARALGYEMNSAQLEEIKAYEHANPKSRENLPTRDFFKRLSASDAELLKRPDVKALAAGDDGDRWE